MKWFTSIILIYFLGACAPATVPSAATAVPTFYPGTKTPVPSVTPYPTPTRAPTWTPEVSATPPGSDVSFSAYDQYTIPALRQRQYGGGFFTQLNTVGKHEKFTRYLIQYPSDGLIIAGYVNVPEGKGPFPVIIMLHGYSDPDKYQTLDYITDAADVLTLDGYIVVHPNYRNFMPSSRGDALFRAGYAVDVLNLISLIRENTGKSGLFQKAKPDRIGLWAHSLGGEIALRVGVISPYVKAIMLYAPMSGDEKKNSQLMANFQQSIYTQKELLASDEDFKLISPSNYYKFITAAIQVHHGDSDSIIPVEWSIDTCKALRDAERDVECYFYEGAEHTFVSRYFKDMGNRVNRFFETYLGN